MTNREIDRLVAEKVMGWPQAEYITDEFNDKSMPIYGWRKCYQQHKKHVECEHQWTCGKEQYFPAPNYSTQIQDAWDVVEKLIGKGTQRGIVNVTGKYYGWLCHYNGNTGEAQAKTMPMAICLAALRAVGEEVTP